MLADMWDIALPTPGDFWAALCLAILWWEQWQGPEQKKAKVTLLREIFGASAEDLQETLIKRFWQLGNAREAKKTPNNQ